MPAWIALALAAAPACDAKSIGAAVDAALAARKRHDDAGAAAAIAPAAACPVDSGATCGARVLAAELAAGRGEWPTVRSLLADIAMHPEMTLGARVRLLLMRADQALGDTGAFAADRALSLVANDAKLAAAGKKIETFRVPAGEVTAYDAVYDQGSFHRVYTFIAIPDDKSAYPVSAMLTDDQSTAVMMKQMGMAGGAAHAWFVDLYRCDTHTNLSPASTSPATPPDYAAVKSRVVEALSAPNAFAAKPADNGACTSAAWLLPGFGLRH